MRRLQGQKIYRRGDTFRVLFKIGQEGEVTAMELLRQWLSSEDPSERELATGLLAEMGPKGRKMAMPELLELLQHEHWSYRRNAVATLGKMGPKAKAASDDGVTWRQSHHGRALRGEIGEVPLPKGWRYSSERIEPVRGASPDENTIAFWTFDEGPTRGNFNGRRLFSYDDESGNRHRVYVVGPLDVHAMRWAELRR